MVRVRGRRVQEDQTAPPAVGGVGGNNPNPSTTNASQRNGGQGSAPPPQSRANRSSGVIQAGPSSAPLGPTAMAMRNFGPPQGQVLRGRSAFGEVHANANVIPSPPSAPPQANPEENLEVVIITVDQVKKEYEPEIVVLEEDDEEELQHQQQQLQQQINLAETKQAVQMQTGGGFGLDGGVQNGDTGGGGESSETVHIAISIPTEAEANSSSTSTVTASKMAEPEAEATTTTSASNSNPAVEPEQHEDGGEDVSGSGSGSGGISAKTVRINSVPSPASTFEIPQDGVDEGFDVDVEDYSGGCGTNGNKVNAQANGSGDGSLAAERAPCSLQCLNEKKFLIDEIQGLKRAMVEMGRRQTLQEDFTQVEFGAKFEKFEKNRRALIENVGIGVVSDSKLEDGKRPAENKELVQVLTLMKEKANETSKGGHSHDQQSPVEPKRSAFQSSVLPGFPLSSSLVPRRDDPLLGRSSRALARDSGDDWDLPSRRRSFDTERIATRTRSRSPSPPRRLDRKDHVGNGNSSLVKKPRIIPSRSPSRERERERDWDWDRRDRPSTSSRPYYYPPRNIPETATSSSARRASRSRSPSRSRSASQTKDNQQDQDLVARQRHLQSAADSRYYDAKSKHEDYTLTRKRKLDPQRRQQPYQKRDYQQHRVYRNNPNQGRQGPSSSAGGASEFIPQKCQVRRVCPLCPKIMKHTSLRQHLSFHHQQKKMSCPICRLEFSVKRNLINHMGETHDLPSGEVIKYAEKSFQGMEAWLDQMMEEAKMPTKEQVEESFAKITAMQAAREAERGRGVGPSAGSRPGGYSRGDGEDVSPSPADDKDRC